MATRPGTYESPVTPVRPAYFSHTSPAVSRPSAPSSLTPQDHTHPSSSSATLCMPPAATCSTFFSPSRRSGPGRSFSVMSSPRPSWPQSASPITKMEPATLPWEGCVTGGSGAGTTIGLTRGRPRPRFAGGSASVVSAAGTTASALRFGAIALWIGAALFPLGDGGGGFDCGRARRWARGTWRQVCWGDLPGLNAQNCGLPWLK
mmetsp:Transcript_39779/g.101714  ORF Transcript_39779/g.101714 Transcript_39779/m.101714 type:complete len:204 (+) Transcript_39779:939-1550(+)